MAILEDMFNKLFPKVVVHAPAETMICKKCGKEYFSRGKYDPGICRECEQEQAQLIGGPLDGNN